MYMYFIEYIFNFYIYLTVDYQSIIMWFCDFYLLEFILIAKWNLIPMSMSFVFRHNHLLFNSYITRQLINKIVACLSHIKKRLKRWPDEIFNKWWIPDQSVLIICELKHFCYQCARIKNNTFWLDPWHDTIWLCQNLFYILIIHFLNIFILILISTFHLFINCCIFLS